MAELSPPRTVRVRVPATSANLGPGFDALGLALARYDETVVRTVGDGLVVEVAGEGATDVPRDESNLLVRALRSGLDHLGVSPDVGLSVSCTLEVPHARGLGSSAAAIVAGLLAARGLVPEGRTRLPDSELLALASAIEGHPDNVAAALLGGLTLAWTDETGAHAVRKEPAADLVATVLVPPARASTAEARGLLPSHVPHADAVHNVARVTLLLEAVTHRPDLLLPATADRLHQRYRQPAMPESLALVEELRSRGAAAVLSGAGPSVLVLSNGSGAEAVAAARPDGWRCLTLQIDREGACALPPDGTPPF